MHSFVYSKFAAAGQRLSGEVNFWFSDQVYPGLCFDLDHNVSSGSTGLRNPLILCSDRQVQRSPLRLIVGRPNFDHETHVGYPTGGQLDELVHRWHHRLSNAQPRPLVTWLMEHAGTREYGVALV
jgi:hypothetical protein